MKLGFFATDEYLNQDFQNKKDNLQQYTDPLHCPLIASVPSYEVNAETLGFRIINPDLKIAGYRLSELKSFDDLRNLVHPNDINCNIDYAKKTLVFGKSMENRDQKLFDYNAQIVFRLLGKNGKKYWIRKSCFVNGFNNGVITHSLSFWEDITYISPSQALTWKLTGPNAAYFDFKFPEISEFREVLTDREAEILRLIARGFSSIDIARFLHLSPHTVNTHRKNMLRKLEVANTPELLSLARDMGVI